MRPGPSQGPVLVYWAFSGSCIRAGAGLYSSEGEQKKLGYFFRPGGGGEQAGGEQTPGVFFFLPGCGTLKENKIGNLFLAMDTAKKN